MPTFAPVVSSGADEESLESESDEAAADDVAAAAPPVVLEADVAALASPDELDVSVADVSVVGDCIDMSVNASLGGYDRQTGREAGMTYWAGSLDS